MYNNNSFKSIKNKAFAKFLLNTSFHYHTVLYLFYIDITFAYLICNALTYINKG